MNKQIYYHFLPPGYAIENLENEKIKLSLINELNDPFELLPRLRECKSLKERNPYHEVRKKVSKKYGLLCFSRKWEEPLLWGHYASKHEGIAIGFEVLTDEVVDIEYVKKDKRPRLILTDNQEKNEALFLDLAKTKYEKWSYEDEARVIIKLSECEYFEKKYFLRFSERLMVKEIILGSKIEKNNLNKIKELANKFKAKVVLARLNWGEYKIVKDGRKTQNFI